LQFSPSFLDEIRDRVTLSTVVGRAVQWDRRKSQPGRGDFWACCPFHTEKSPSFHADDRKGFYHCFGCKASGDVFTFMVEKEGLSFPEAVERLAAEAGLALPEAGPQEAARAEERASLHEVMEIAAKFFEPRWVSHRAGRRAPISPGAASMTRSCARFASALPPTTDTPSRLTCQSPESRRT
jgi:DNA primase